MFRQFAATEIFSNAKSKYGRDLNLSRKRPEWLGSRSCLRPLASKRLSGRITREGSINRHAKVKRNHVGGGVSRGQTHSENSSAAVWRILK